MAVSQLVFFSLKVYFTCFCSNVDTNEMHFKAMFFNMYFHFNPLFVELQSLYGFVLFLKFCFTRHEQYAKLKQY